MSEIGERSYILPICIGLFSGFISALAGGRTLITVTILLFFGIPPITAIGTAKFASVGFPLGVLKKYWHSGYILWKRVPGFAVIAILFGYVGSTLLLDIPEHVLFPLVALVLLCFLPFLLWSNDLGVVAKHMGKKHIWLGYILYILAAVYGGLFGGGVGILVMYICLYCFGFTILQMKATNTIPRLLLNITATLSFFFAGIIDVYLGLLLMVGMIIGGYFGADVAIRKGNERLKRIMAVFIVVSAMKLLWPYI